jgi:hypothetical protein
MKFYLLPLAATAYLFATGQLWADDAPANPPPAPVAAKDGGAVMIVPISPPLSLRYSTAAACEAEKDRLKKSLKVECIHLN